MILGKNITVALIAITSMTGCLQQQSSGSDSESTKTMSSLSSNVSDIPTDDIPRDDVPTDPVSEPLELTCTFNGVTLKEGEGITAFQNSNAAYGDSCVAETRICTKGYLSGSFQYASCNVDQPASCLFDGKTIEHGQSILAFNSSAVAYGNSCQSETRTCDNGVLSGSAEFASCNVNQPASCLFDGKTIEHGQSILAFNSSTVAYGNTCQSETRTCDNGVLSGSAEFASCNVNQPASCLFDGKTLAHRQVITLFKNSTVPLGSVCESETRVCENGTLSGSAQHKTCDVEDLSIPTQPVEDDSDILPPTNTNPDNGSVDDSSGDNGSNDDSSTDDSSTENESTDNGSSDNGAVDNGSSNGGGAECVCATPCKHHRHGLGHGYGHDKHKHKHCCKKKKHKQPVKQPCKNKQPVKQPVKQPCKNKEHQHHYQGNGYGHDKHEDRRDSDCLQGSKSKGHH